MKDYQTDRPLTVVLADDHAIVREGIACLCEAHGFRVLGQCGDGAAAVELVLTMGPDLAIIDVHMPVMDGIQAIRELRAAGTSAKLMVLSVSRDETMVRDALDAGADAYLVKDGPSRHLMDAVGFVRDGGVYVSPLLRGAGFYARIEGKAAPSNPLANLSPREVEVFSHLVNGLRPKDIALQLAISPKTVDTYRAGLMRKLEIKDLVTLVKFAIEHNLTGISAGR